MDRVRSFLSSPQGQRASQQAKKMASDPHRRQQAKGLLARLRGR